MNNQHARDNNTREQAEGDAVSYILGCLTGVRWYRTCPRCGKCWRQEEYDEGHKCDELYRAIEEIGREQD